MEIAPLRKAQQAPVAATYPVSLPDDETRPALPREIPQLTEHLFRHEAGKLVSILTGIFGVERLQLAEDVVQESLIRALQTWPYYGIPDNPTAWLMQTAKRLALDVVRREKNFHDKQTSIIATMESWSSSFDELEPSFDEEIRDRRLRLIFACCHPQLPRDAQTALALKTLCGFSPAEIAKAFLSTEAAIAKRLTRARQRIQELKIPFAIPSGPELPERLNAVRQVVYLLFNEGYKASSGENLLREDLCFEAIRLASHLTELAQSPAAVASGSSAHIRGKANTSVAKRSDVGAPVTHALLALMWLNAARFKTRVDTEGNLLRLSEQDRSRWDGKMIAQGISHLMQAADGEELSEYHLQAGIAACHCTAPDSESTDWVTILDHYDRWIAINASPVVALNRTIAIAHVHGPDAALKAVKAMPHVELLDAYYLYHAVLGDFESQRQRNTHAANHFRRALELTEVPSERAFLQKRLGECKV
ncbi:sigma factor, ECF subfamily protein [Verrucomicrobia bacterium LW23]|nr:sigma factor, ECF subfamily protein [Verrucomicrobia bacterium LW23]